MPAPTYALVRAALAPHALAKTLTELAAERVPVLSVVTEYDITPDSRPVGYLIVTVRGAGGCGCESGADEECDGCDCCDGDRTAEGGVCGGTCGCGA